MSLTRIQQIGSTLFLAGIVTGCGGSEVVPQSQQAASSQTEMPQQTAEVTESTASTESKPSGVTVAIESPGKANTTTTGESPTAGSEEKAAKLRFPDDEATKTLREIQQLRIAPIPTEMEKARAARRERNERIVDMATNVLRLTMNEESRKPQFHQAIGQLLEARFQMALSGTQDDVDLLYADVQALNDRDPKSIAAAEGVYYIARFAHTKAGLNGRNQPIWFETLSQRAREFADRFPEQSQRAVSLLFGAGRSCELHSLATTDVELAARLMTECKLCYTALAQKFPASEQGQEATASLRRLALPGQLLSQFSGPTADGGFVSADEFPGKPTLIYFWDSESEEFDKDLLPLLAKIRSQLTPERLRIIGVALDEDESTMNSFMETHSVPGQQIFFANAEQRSWNSPLVRFWGVAKSPSVWLVDANGKVVSTAVGTAELIKQLQPLIK